MSATDARTVVVLAGGLGTRLLTVTQGLLPKALVPVAGRPFLAHKLSELQRRGAQRVVLLLGTHADQIVRFVGSHPTGLDVICLTDGDRLLGTGGAIKHAAAALPDLFWVTYGDTLLDADLPGIEAWARRRRLDAVMTVLRNDDRWQPSNVELDGDLVASYQKGASAGSHRYLDYGYLLLPKEAFITVVPPAFDLAVVLDALVRQHSLGGYPVVERFHDIGTAAALAETERWLIETGSAVT